MKKKWMVGGLAFAVVVSALIGVAAKPAFANDCGSELTSVEDEGAQDTNGDGIATVAEGAFDCDQDGKFTLVDADCLGICIVLNWGQIDTGGSSTVITKVDGHLCKFEKINGVWKSNCAPDSAYDCYTKSGAVGCSYSKKR